MSRAIGPLSVCCSGLNGRPSYRNRRTRRRVTITNRLCLVVPAHGCAIWHVTKCADQRERKNARYGSTHPPIVPDAHDCPLQGNRTSWTRVAGGSSARGAPTVAANLQPRTHLITLPSALFKPWSDIPMCFTTGRRRRRHQFAPAYAPNDYAAACAVCDSSDGKLKINGW